MIKNNSLNFLAQQEDKFTSKLRIYSVKLKNSCSVFEIIRELHGEKNDSLKFRVGFCEQYKYMEKVIGLLKLN